MKEVATDEREQEDGRLISGGDGFRVGESLASAGDYVLPQMTEEQDVVVEEIDDEERLERDVILEEEQYQEVLEEVLEDQEEVIENVIDLVEPIREVDEDLERDEEDGHPLDESQAETNCMAIEQEKKDVTYPASHIFDYP